MKKLQA